MRTWDSELWNQHPVVAKASRVHDTESHECVEEKISSLLQAKGSEHGYLTRLSSF